MGILNVTPDSFSDGGKYLKPLDAVEHALRMIDEGANLIDIGGESTRPGSKPVPVDKQKKRVLPVIEALVKKHKKIVVSIDTQDSQVADAALAAGASMVNDISALQNDPEMTAVCAKHKAAVVLMHMQKTPEMMQENPRYVDIVSEVKSFLQSRIEAAEKVGIVPESIVVDVGIGFGKSVNHNLVLVREMSQFHALRKPLLAGLSRKSFIGKVLNIDDPAERLIGTAAATAWCVAGNVQILRVHDVKEMKQVAQVIQAIGAGRQVN